MSSVKPKTKQKQKTNPEILILALIMLINALSYGTIIPLLYPYASRFGINPFGLSLLLASYSFFQFLATPIIGRLSDRYGRKPLLLLSIFGTAVSLALFASAQNMIMLFAARILDGITGGNTSVAQAMIADKVDSKNRAQAFGMLGAAFGFGFLVGPAIGGILSNYGLTIPFWFASALALIATILGSFILKESVTKINVAKQRSEPLFNFPVLIKSLFSPVIGTILIISFIAATASNVFIIGFQAYSVDILLLNASRVGIIFGVVGLVTILMQVSGIKWLIKTFKSKSKIIKYSFLGTATILFLMSFSLPYYFFISAVLIYVLFNSAVNPLVSALISERTNAEDQGAILGINQSYLSLGQIFGPISAGIVSNLSVPLVFAWAGILMLCGFIFSQFSKVSSKKVNI